MDKIIENVAGAVFIIVVIAFICRLGWDVIKEVLFED